MGLANSDTTLAILKNPINLQKLVLDDLQARLGGSYEIVDPNNTGMFLIEKISTLTANFAAATELAISETNALRAQTTEALARNMSDYDYVNMFSTPSSTTILMTLDKKYLEDNALNYNDNYKKVVIPKDTVFSFGDYTFGLYYPIEIRINRTTGTPLVVFDTTEENPLHTLKQNIVPFMEQTVYQMKLLVLKIPVYQISRSIIEEDLVAELGFANSYSYQDKFFAVRIFSNPSNSEIELHQTLSPSSYDPYSPTARVTVAPESKTFKINIPQIYFSAGMMGSKLKMEVFTTKGKIDLDVSNITPESILCNFNLTKASSEYSKILSMVPTIICSMGQSRITGGSDGYSFEELRTRVINNSFYTSVLVTPMDFEKYFSDHGFRILRYMDNLTNLIYFGYKTLTDENKMLVPSMTGQIKFLESMSESVSTILENIDGTFTILPKTIYKFDQASLTCIPLTTEEVNALSNLSKTELIEEMNSSIYTRSPFHMRLIPDGRYTKVGSYNLMNPTIEDLIFDKENVNITAQMVATSATIVHLNEGAGGYKVQFLINKSTDLKDVPEEDLMVYLYTEASDGVLVGTRLTLSGSLGGALLYDAVLETDYTISRDHHLNLTSLQNDSSIWDHYVNLASTFHIVFLVNKNYFPTAMAESSLYVGVPDSLSSTHLVMLRQKCTITLGYSLEDVVFNDINLQWTEKRYALHPVDVPMTYPADVYATDSLGNVAMTFDPDTCEVSLTKEHSKGDPVLDEYGNPVYINRAGDIRYDESGKPIQVADRVQLYYINALMVDAKLYVSEHPLQVEFRKNLTSTLEAYFAVLREASTMLLERDLLYFRPIRTLGSSLFHIGDGIQISLPLTMSISLRCHVQSNVANDSSLKTTIIQSIIDIIDPIIAEKRISLTEIASTVKEKIEYLEAVDVLGIDGNYDLQTLTITDDSVQPTLAQVLYLTKDNTIALKKSVDVEFVTV